MSPLFAGQRLALVSHSRPLQAPFKCHQEASLPVANISALVAQEAFDRGGLSALADALEQHALDTVFSQLITVSVDAQKVAADNFARGEFAAYRELSSLLKAIK